MTASPRKRGSVLLVTLCVASGLAGGGCSFIFVDGPPTQHKKMPYFDCTSSNVLPVIDTVLAGVYGIGAAGEIASSAQSNTSSSTEPLIALGVATVFAASAVTGYSKTSSCREAKSDLLERASQQPGGFGAPGFAPASPPPGYGMPAPYDPWLGPAPAGAPPDTPPPGASAAPAPAPTPGAPAPAKPQQVQDPDEPAHP
jgi:hypothetical protein